MSTPLSISVIVPTYNEEKTLPTLLDSIQNQTILPHEVIVADNTSTDATRVIANDYHCEIVDGGSPGVGRNNGAKRATGDLLIFIDADAYLHDKRFFERILSVVTQSNFGFGTCYYRAPRSTNMKGALITKLINLKKKLNHVLFYTTGRIISLSGGVIVVKKDVFDSVVGFDEKLDTFEDRDLGKRLIEHGFVYQTIPASITISMRRYEERSVYELLLLSATVFLYRRSEALHLKSAEKNKKTYDEIKGKLGGK